MQKDVKVGLVIGLVFVTALIVFLARHFDREEMATEPEVKSSAFVERVHTMTESIDTMGGEEPIRPPGEGEAADADLQTEEGVETAQPAEGPQPGPKTWKVKKGDTLWHIAEECYGDGKMMNLIVRANRDRIADPDHLRVGLELVIPGAEEEPVLLSISPSEEGSFDKYTAKKGDTLWSIAEKYYHDGSQWLRILRANKSLHSEKDLNEGMVILIPLDESKEE